MFFQLLVISKGINYSQSPEINATREDSNLILPKSRPILRIFIGLSAIGGFLSINKKALGGKDRAEEYNDPH